MAKDETEQDDATTDETTSKEGAPSASKAAVAKPAAASPASSPRVDEDEEDEEDEDDDEEDDEDEDEDDDADDEEDAKDDGAEDEVQGRAAAGEESAPEEDTDRAHAPPATASDAPGAPVSAKKVARAESTEHAALDPEPPRAGGVRKRAPLPPDPPPVAVGKTVGLFIAVIGLLSAGFWFLGAETGGARTAPRWKTGQTVDVNITLVPTDRNDLACASPTVVADRRCEFENKTKAVAPKPEDDKLLKPYTTTDGVQFLAAGLWSQQELAPGKLPSERFTVKCKYTVEGEVKRPGVRWNVRGGFGDKDNTWYAGTVKDCALAP